MEICVLSDVQLNSISEWQEAIDMKVLSFDYPSMSHFRI
jgi:hypothetical protein